MKNHPFFRYKSLFKDEQCLLHQDQSYRLAKQLTYLSYYSIVPLVLPHALSPLSQRESFCAYV